MALTANVESAVTWYHWIETKTFCIYWQKEGDVTNFYSTSTWNNVCGEGKSDMKSKDSTQTTGTQGMMHFVCWEKVVVKNQRGTPFPTAGCNKHCYCPVQRRGKTPASGSFTFEKKMGIKYNPDGTVKQINNSGSPRFVPAQGEKIVENLSGNKYPGAPAPAKWEIVRSAGCRGTNCPMEEGVTK